MAEGRGPDARPGEDPLGPGAPPGGGRRNGTRSLVVTPICDHAPGPRPHLRKWGASRGVPGQVIPRQRKAPAPPAAGVLCGFCHPLSPHPGFRESDSEPRPHRFTYETHPERAGKLQDCRGTANAF